MCACFLVASADPFLYFEEWLRKTVHPKIRILMQTISILENIMGLQLYPPCEIRPSPALKPLPAEKYQYAEWCHAKIHMDYHFISDDHFYSVPYKYLHHEVEI